MPAASTTAPNAPSLASGQTADGQPLDGRATTVRGFVDAGRDSQIRGWLMTLYPDEPALHVSHETMSYTLILQTRGPLKRELTARPRTVRPIRRSKQSACHRHKAGQIRDAISIAERPASNEDRAVPGHWEGDLIQGTKHTFFTTLVERWSRYVQFVRVTSEETAGVTSALTRELQRIPAGRMAMLTWDRDHEMVHHDRLRPAIHVAVYFCDPHSPGKRGSNVNTNRHLRQHSRKGIQRTSYAQRQLDAVTRRLSTRPRLTIG